MLGNTYAVASYMIVQLLHMHMPLAVGLSMA